MSAPWPKWYKPPTRAFRVDRMIREACNAYGIDPAQFISAGRFKNFVRPRQAVCLALRNSRKELSYPQIARLVGRKDHSTIIHAVHQAEVLRGTDEQFGALCDRLEILAA